MSSPENRKTSAIVIPAYRAESTLSSVIGRIPAAFWETGSVIIVNDASPDGTGQVARELAAGNPRIAVVDHPENRGYGGALKSGLRVALNRGADGVAVVHSDGQYAPERVLDLLAPVLHDDAYIVQGSRLLGGGARGGGMPLTRYIPNRVLTTIENLAFGTRMREFHSGYMVYSRTLLQRVPYEKLQDNYNFDAEMILMAHLVGMRCAEIAIPTRYDEESSSLSPIPYGLNVLRMIGRHIAGHYRGLLEEHRQAMGAAIG